MGQVPIVDMERCIYCGTCVVTCKPKAITYRSDLNKAKELINEKDTISIALLDPSISSEFFDTTDYRKLSGMLRYIGFNKVYETTFAIDLISQQYSSFFNNFRGKYYITSACPVIVFYIEKYHSLLINNLTPLATPMIVMSRLIRSKLDKNVRIIYIGPCLGSKEEYLLKENQGLVDAVLTFEELRILFNECGIHESMLEFSEIDEPEGKNGYLFPISNGIIEGAEINCNLKENIVITIDGNENMIKYLDAFENRNEEINCNFNMFYCTGCLMGPGTRKNINILKKRSLVIEYAQRRQVMINLEKWNEDIKKYNNIDLKRTFNPKNVEKIKPSDDKIKEVLASIGMDSNDKEVNCGACGYDSCYEFATDVAKGLTIPEMCVMFTLKNQQHYIQSLKLTNETLAKTQAALVESEQKARQDREFVREASETVTAMLQKLRSGVVLIDRNFKVLQANNRFIEMMGDEVKEISEIIPLLTGADIKSLLPYSFYNIVEYVFENNVEVINRDIKVSDMSYNVSIFPLRGGKIAGCIIRDLFHPEFRNEEIINRLNEVIDKNLTMVQKIGYILGESAAETELMLNAIIKSYKQQDKS